MAEYSQHAKLTKLNLMSIKTSKLYYVFFYTFIR